MLYSVFRIIVIAVIVLALGWAVSWLGSNGDELRLALAGREYRPSLLGVVIAIAVVLGAFWLFIEIVRFLLALLSFVMGDKNAIAKFFGRRRLRKGLAALTDAVAALSGGDSKTALAKAYKADKNLDQPVLTGLIVAQSARAEGKSKEVETALKKLLEYDNGRFPAIRGLMAQRLASGDHKTAMELAKKAIAQKPSDAETINTLFELQVEAENWADARETLKAKVKAEKLPADIARRREAVLAIAEAQSLEGEDNQALREERIMLAHRLAPNLVPAAILAAELRAAQGNIRAADTILVKAWNNEPHPDIAAAYGRLLTDDSPEARLRHFRVLLKRQKDHPETRMLAAELLIGVGDFPDARRALGDLADNPKTARGYAIMAAIAHGEGLDDHVVRAYLSQAAQASRGAQWVCDECGHIHSAWAPVCSECGHFDRMSWKVPPENPDIGAGLGVVLPMLEKRSGAGELVEVAHVDGDAAVDIADMDAEAADAAVDESETTVATRLEEATK